jgi:hypothetical protein
MSKAFSSVSLETDITLNVATLMAGWIALKMLYNWGVITRDEKTITTRSLAFSALLLNVVSMVCAYFGAYLFKKSRYWVANEGFVSNMPGVMRGSLLNSIGLIVSFFGVIVLLYYSIRTEGSTTKTDRDSLVSQWWQWVGYILLALGFFAQIVATAIGGGQLLPTLGS